MKEDSGIGHYNKAFIGELNPDQKKENGHITNPSFTAEKPEKKDEKDALAAISFYGLFRFATGIELFSTFLGVFFGILTGLYMPALTILYAEFISLMIDRVTGNENSQRIVILTLFGGGKNLVNATTDQFMDALIEDARAFGIGSLCVSIFELIVGAIAVDLANYSALKQINRIRQLFLRSVIRQDMEWFDVNAGVNVAGRITEDLEKIKEGIGEKIPIFGFLLSSFIVSVIMAFIYGWKLTLVMLSFAPINIFATAIVAKVQSNLTAKELEAYSKAGTVAEEVLGSIRTVVAFEGQDKESERFEENMRPAIQTGVKKGTFSGIGTGLMWLIVYLSYAVGFWYGVNLILDDRGVENAQYTPEIIMIVFFGVLSGAESLGMTAPHMESFTVARGAAAFIYSIIDREPKIDPLSTRGLKPDGVIGNIEFKNVNFHYPARPDVKIFEGLNLKINTGETVALVGSSGCGKSTIVQLIQRLYDPMSGSVSLDGNDISKLNIEWLRTKIGIVGQEPVLFTTTIGDNISYGRPGATQEEIEQAAAEANCHEFITKLPNGYDTMVGDRGAQLSGGQKQRIAIARALIRQPSILLLDEATSALDLDSEAKVQKALDQARVGRTTIIVAHRLSTITNADRIVVLQNGAVAETGTHLELLSKQGLYYNLVSTGHNDENQDSKKRESVEKGRKSIGTNSLSNIVRTETETFETSESVTDEDSKHDTSLFRLIKLNKPEWSYLAIGCIAAIVVGTSFPAFAVLFGEVFGVFLIEDRDEVLKETLFYSICFLVVGIITGLGGFLQAVMFNIAGVKLTTRLRQQTFEAIIRQEMGWFDEAKNSVGALCARLADDAVTVQGATGSRISVLLQAFSTLIVGFCVAMFYSWKLSLAAITCIPLIYLSVFLEGKLANYYSKIEKSAMSDLAKIAVEAITNVRTVAGLSQEKYVLERFENELITVNNALRNKTRLRGIVFSFGQAAPFFSYAVSMYYGGYLVARENLEYKNVIKVSEALIFGSWMTGQALAHAPNFNAAMYAAGRIFKLLDRVPLMHSIATLPSMEKWQSQGDIKYSKVEFRYPSRPEVQVLQGLNLEIKSGQTVALVGQSGCGKSTCIQLVQRLYDPDYGTLHLDNKDIKTDLSLTTLRRQLGIVSQEPVLFDRTIAENIAYGDNTRHVSMEEIIQAAKQSNIHNFIVNLPQGYETRLGQKGTQLSGGQKQRIAIARALVRNPKVLLLDEATSALDAQSEKVVQTALDQARAGRTCITIAHRLATVRTADVICVVKNGQVVEKGSHDELVARGGLYSEMHALQL